MEDNGLDIVRMFRDIQEKRDHIAEKSKFKIGQPVRVTEDKDKLIEYLLMSGGVRTHINAVVMADHISGRIMKVRFAEELINDDGTKGMYVNLEDQYGFLHLLPEDLVRDYRER